MKKTIKHNVLKVIILASIALFIFLAYFLSRYIDLSSINNKHCKMTVFTEYGGANIAGDPLEGGEFSQEIIVTDGTILYEGFDGRLSLKNPSSNADDTHSQILKINSVDDDKVTVVLHNGTTMSLAYGSEMNLYSLYVTYDSFNYWHTVSFSDFKDK